MFMIGFEKTSDNIFCDLKQFAATGEIQRPGFGIRFPGELSCPPEKALCKKILEQRGLTASSAAIDE